MKYFILLIIISSTLTSAEKVPSEVLDLSYWKITMPYTDEKNGKAKEIKHPEFLSFEKVDNFFVNQSADGVVFRAHCTNATTKSSKYPRCELREMKSGGKEKASWSTSEGSHTLTLTQAITAVPPVKKHVVCAQIHDADDDLMMVRLEGKKLFVERNKIADVPLDNNYKLGTKFKIKIQAADKQVKVWYNGDLKMDWKVSAKGCYFKAGCYTQSNPSKGDKPESYGEVLIYDLKVDHKE